VAGAVYSRTYKLFRRQLVVARKDARLSQAQLAEMLGKPPSFVAKYELGERRLDVVELCVILKCMDVDPNEFLLVIFEDAPRVLP
jgi:transcriptional regulator with XRE-family HTH domain